MTNVQNQQEVDYLYKSLNGQFNVDEAQGIVEAFVAGIGNKDSVGDICLPGCFGSSLKRRKPRVVWGHDWNSPIGKVLEIYEVGPNDPRLPSKMRKAGIGGLYAKVQFNLKAEKGREAFANVSFFGLEQEWSIGYKTLDAVFDPVQTANLLKEVELYEVSPVLHGANQLTGTISIKADSMDTEDKDGEAEIKAAKPVLRDPKGGLTAAGRAHFKRTEGSNLKPGVKGPADTPEKMRRKGSFLTRFFTNPSGPMKKPNGKPTRLALSAAAWGEPVPQDMSDAAKLAAKGRRLLDRYENSKKKKKDDAEEIDTKNHVVAIYNANQSMHNEAFGRASELTRALAVRFGGPVRLVTADNDIAIFEMGAGQSTQTMRVAYHYDGDEFMFGTAQTVKPETVYIPISDASSQPVAGISYGIAEAEEKPKSSCCPGCGKGGNCDASVALTEDENPKIAFIKLKSLGDQLGFKVDSVDGGFVLRGFGMLTPEAQEYVVSKIDDGWEKKLLNPTGSLASSNLGVPNLRGSLGRNMNPWTARNADSDMNVLEGIATINMGRGVPDPTPFGIQDVNVPGFNAPEVPEIAVPGSRRRRNGDIAPRMPAVPRPAETPDEVPEKTPSEPKPVREPIQPRVPSRPKRNPVPVPEPKPQPSVPEKEPAKEPVPVPRREPVQPRQPVPVGEADNDNFAIAAMGGGRKTPKELADSLSESNSRERPSKQTNRQRLTDVGYEEMRSLMLLDDAMSGPLLAESPLAAMGRRRQRTREESADLGRKIWLERTHDKISLEQAGKKYGVTREEARQLELRHKKYLSSLGEDHPNRVGRAHADMPEVPLTDGERDLLRRRFDGETLDESAERLGTDRNAVRRMEQLALSKVRSSIASEEPSGAMGFRRGGRAVDTVNRPKGRKNSIIRNWKNSSDVTFSQIKESLEDSYSEELTPSEIKKIAAMMRLRRAISHRIDQLLGSGVSRRMSNLGPEIDELNRVIAAPHGSTAEAARIVTGDIQDLISSSIKVANGIKDPLNLDLSINAVVFNALHEASGDYQKVADALGMDRVVVEKRARAHALLVMASATPARREVAARLISHADMLDAQHKYLLRAWLDGVADEDLPPELSRLSEGVLAKRKREAFEKIGMDPSSPEMIRRIASGRIFYDEHGLFSELTDDDGNRIFNRIGDGPTAGMSAGMKRVVSADFGSGRRDYVVARSDGIDDSTGGEKVYLRPLSGDDEATVQSLIGREVLSGDERGLFLDIPATLKKSEGRIVGVYDKNGNEMDFYGERSIDVGGPFSTTPARGRARRANEFVLAIRENAIKAESDVSSQLANAELTAANLESALSHLEKTGDWIGADLKVVSYLVDDPDKIAANGFDSYDDGTTITPKNTSWEEFSDDVAASVLRRNPDATQDQINDAVARAHSQKMERVKRKADLLRKEAARLKKIMDDREERKRQNVVDLEVLPDDLQRSLTEETRALSNPSLRPKSNMATSRYVVHKGPGHLDGGILSPAATRGIEGTGEVAAQGDTRGANRNFVRSFMSRLETEKELLSQLERFLAKMERGETRIDVPERLSYALNGRLLGRAWSPQFRSIDLNEWKGRINESAIRNLLNMSKSDVNNMEKVVSSLRAHGGENMDQFLSAYGDPIEALATLAFYGRYPESSIPNDVAVAKPGFVEGTESPIDVVDPTMYARWTKLGGVRAGAFLAVGRKYSDIVSPDIQPLGPQSEVQIVSPLKPLIGISTPNTPDDRFNGLAKKLGPAIMARAIKMHQRDGYVDLETVLTDPSLAPEGMADDLDPAAGMAPRIRSVITDEEGRLDPALTRDAAIVDARHEDPFERLLAPRRLLPDGQPSIFVDAPPMDMTPEARRAAWSLGIAEGLIPDQFPERGIHVVSPSAVPKDARDGGRLLMLDAEPDDFLGLLIADMNGAPSRAGARQMQPEENRPTLLIIDVVAEPKLNGVGNAEGGSTFRGTRVVRVLDVLGRRLDRLQPFWRSPDEESLLVGRPGRRTTPNMGFIELLIQVDPEWDGDIVSDDKIVVRVAPENIIGRIVSEEELSTATLLTREIYGGNGAYTITNLAPDYRIGDDPTAAMTSSGKDIVERSLPYRKNDEGYVVPRSVMNERDQDDLTRLSKLVESGTPLSVADEIHLRKLVAVAENSVLPRSSVLHPHDRDVPYAYVSDFGLNGPRFSGVVSFEEFAELVDVPDQLGTLAPDAKIFAYYPPSGGSSGLAEPKPIYYIPVRIGLGNGRIDSQGRADYHPGSRIYYVEVVIGEENGKRVIENVKRWNHPENVDDDSYGSVANWPEINDFNRRLAEIQFQLGRTKLLDDSVGWVGPSPREVIKNINDGWYSKVEDLPNGRRGNSRGIVAGQRFEAISFDDDGYATSYGEGLATAYGLDIAPGSGQRLPRNTYVVKPDVDPYELERLTGEATREGKPLTLFVVSGARPGDPGRPRIERSDVYMPTVKRGEVDEVTRDFAESPDGSAHVVGYDKSGKSVAHPVKSFAYENQVDSTGEGNRPAERVSSRPDMVFQPVSTTDAKPVDFSSASEESAKRYVDPYYSFDPDETKKRSDAHSVATSVASRVQFVVPATLTPDGKLLERGKVVLSNVAIPRIADPEQRALFESSFAYQVGLAVEKAAELDREIGIPGAHVVSFTYPGKDGKTYSPRMVVNARIVRGVYDDGEIQVFPFQGIANGGDWPDPTSFTPNSTRRLSEIDLASVPIEEWRSEAYYGIPSTNGERESLQTYLIGDELLTEVDDTGTQRIIGTQRKVFNTKRMMQNRRDVSTMFDDTLEENVKANAAEATDSEEVGVPKTPKTDASGSGGRSTNPPRSASSAPQGDDDYRVAANEQRMMKKFPQEIPLQVTPHDFGSQTASPTIPARVDQIPELRPSPVAGNPTPDQVAEGLATNDPRALAARRNDERKFWQIWKSRRPGGSVLGRNQDPANKGPRKGGPSEEPIKDADGNVLINPITGRPLYPTPFKKAWKPWGNGFAKDGTELPKGIRDQLDNIRDWGAFKNWVMGNVLVFFDFETTGIVEGTLDKGKPIQAFFYIIDPSDPASAKQLEVWIHPGNTPLSQWTLDNVTINGRPITPSILSDRTIFKSVQDAVAEIKAFLPSDPIFVAHNARNFDIELLRDLIPDIQMKGWIDTLALANWLFLPDNERFKALEKISRSPLAGIDANDTEKLNWARRRMNELFNYAYTNWLTNLLPIPGHRGTFKVDGVMRRRRWVTGPLWGSLQVGKNPNGTPKKWWRPYGSQKLEALANFFGIDLGKAHSAVDDTVGMFNIFMEMINLGERWGSTQEMFDPEFLDHVVRDADYVYSGDLDAWRIRSGASTQETLFGNSRQGGGGTSGAAQGGTTGGTPGGGTSGGSGAGGGRPGGSGAGGGGNVPPSTTGGGGPSFNPDRVMLQELPSGNAIFKGKDGIYLEIRDISPSDSLDAAQTVAVEVAQARQDGHGFQFAYGLQANGSPYVYRIYSMELVPKQGLTEQQARQMGIGGFELHGIDSMTGRLLAFDFAMINAPGARRPRQSDIELGTTIYTGMPGRPTMSRHGVGAGHPMTATQYADYQRRVNYNKNHGFDGPHAGMSGLTNRDGYSDSSSYWRASDMDFAASRMTDEQLSDLARTSRTKFDNLFYSGPGANREASDVLDTIAAANRVIRIRTPERTEDNGFSVSMSRSGYELSGTFVPPPGSISQKYRLPKSFRGAKREMAKNASLSADLNLSIASGSPRDAVTRLARLSAMSPEELLARISSHDFDSYVASLARKKFTSIADNFFNGSLTVSSARMFVDPTSELGEATRMTDAVMTVIGSDGFGPSAAMARNKNNLADKSLEDLLRDFNESVSELFDYSSDGRYQNPEFKVKSDAIKERLSDIANEITRRYFQSEEGRAIISRMSDEPQAGMSVDSPFGERDGLPILSGSSWLDARLHAIYGDEKYEQVAKSIGERFRTLPDRNWNAPTDDDLVDLYQYTAMLHHDSLIDALVARREAVPESSVPSSEAFDELGSVAVIAQVAKFARLSPDSVLELADRGRDVAFVRKLASMDPFSRAEEMNAARRRRAFRRLIDEKRKQLGPNFPMWLAEASLRNDSWQRRAAGDADMINNMGGPYAGFFGEDVPTALSELAAYMGMDDDGPNAAMSNGRRPFIRQRYDIKPHGGGWVIIDTDNRNAISSRVFSDRRYALKGAARMDRGDRSFDPFKAEPGSTPNDGGPNAGMNVSRLPKTLSSGKESSVSRATREQVSKVMDDYENGRASIPFASPDFSSVSRLMDGYVASDAGIGTILSRIDSVSEEIKAGGARRNAVNSEISSLMENLTKLQKRRNYFYNQLKERLDFGSEELSVLEGWHSRRSGMGRESTTRFGVGGLPEYNFPVDFLSATPVSGMSSPTYSTARRDEMFMDRIVSEATSEATKLINGTNEAEYSIRKSFDRIAKSVNDDLARLRRTNKGSALAATYYSVQLGARVMAMASRIGEEQNSSQMRRAIVSVGLREMIKAGGPRMGLAFLVNAVNLGLVSPKQARIMLSYSRRDGIVSERNIDQREEAITRQRMSKLYDQLVSGGNEVKSAGFERSEREVSVIRETLASSLVG